MHMSLTVTGRMSEHLASYWEANMELIDIVPEFNLYEEYWKIYTKSDDSAASVRCRGRCNRAQYRW